MKNFCFISLKAFEEQHCTVYIYVLYMYIYIYVRIHSYIDIYIIIVDVRFLSGYWINLYFDNAFLWYVYTLKQSCVRDGARISASSYTRTRYLCTCVCVSVYVYVYYFNSLTLIFLFFFSSSGPICFWWRCK